MEQDHKNYLWYIIPGILLLLPLKDNLLKIFPEVEVSIGVYISALLMFAFVAGYILHAIYRVFYNSIIFYFRPLIGTLKRKIKGEHGIEVARGQVDNLYNLFIYSSGKFTSHISQVKKQSFYLSSIFSSILGSLGGIGIIYLIAYNRTLGIFYSIVTILLVINYLLVFVMMNNEETALVIDKFEKFDKCKINKILNDFKRYSWRSTMKKKKTDKVHLEVMERYCWGVGIALVVVGATSIFKSPIGTLITGIIFLFSGVVISTILRKK